jgi:hypothetical protein
MLHAIRRHQYRPAVEDANATVRGLTSVTDIAVATAKQTETLVGRLHGIDPTLDLARLTERLE